MSDLFQRIEERREDKIVEVIVTFLEIYNEEIRDLLAEPGTHVPRGGLAIREDKTVKVVGLTELRPSSAEEVKEIVLLGNKRRTQSPTLANATSSRSHAVLQVQVTQSPRTASLTEEKTVATLSIIDLAGSERASATTNMGQRMVEGANINKSLLALGNCINALCESGGAVRHVPYRNSKLTRLLKFSLGGNCKTVMIVCVAPTSNHFDDTHNTLIYAERATRIKTKVVTRNVLNVDRHVGQYVEAIQRLNLEIKELKEKLSSKRAAESEVQARKAKEAKEEVERAKNDLKAKFEHTQASIVDGANCTGKVSVAKIKLAAIQNRLAQIESEGSTGPSAAEKALLQALAGPEEEALKPNSPINLRLQKAGNSSAMFDATMRAVAERKSDRLDEPSTEIVKTQAALRRAEMECAKLQSERDSIQRAAEDMADIVVKLVGMMGRCTVYIGDSTTRLQNSESEEVKEVARTLSLIREKNDEMFKNLLGHSTETYTSLGQIPVQATLDPFLSYGATFTRRVSTGMGPPAPFSKPSRRMSAAAALAGPTSPRRAHRSPRKSLRASVALPYVRRVSAELKEAKKEKKSVQWRDEAGRGDLDDGGANPATSASTSTSAAPPSNGLPPPVVSVIPAGSSLESTTDPFRSTDSPVMMRPGSAMGSESEWEDEERTEDSLNLSGYKFANLSASTSRLSASTASGSSVPSSMSSSVGLGRRPRASRLDPSFLKSKSRMGPSLGSVMEGDERVAQDMQPLTDREFNLDRSVRRGQKHSNEDSSSSTSTAEMEDRIHVPKAKDRHLGSPTKRMPSTLSRGSVSSVGMGLSSSVNGKPLTARRRSAIGPVRPERPRRRSSLIPQLSPRSSSVSADVSVTGSRASLSASVSASAKTGARRMAVAASPARRVKRASLTRSLGAGGRVKPMAALSVGGAADGGGTGACGSADQSGGNLKPTWR